VIDTYGLEIANEQVDEAVAFVTRDIFERVREMWLRGNADTGGRRLGPCVCQCPSRPHPAASGYLMMGAALVPFEPAAAMRKQAVISGAEARPEPYCKSDDHPLRTHHWYYERDAIAWDTDRGRNLVEKLWLDRFTSLLPGGGSVLDLGCGSGEPIGRYLTEHGLSVIGID